MSVLFGAFGSPGPTRAATTPICTAGEIVVDILPFQPVDDFSVPYARLKGLASEVGLVRQTTTVKVDGCRATVGYADPELFVASELRRSRCAFLTVLRHEERHVELYETALVDLEARIRAAAADRPLFDAAVQEVRAIETAQAAVDSPDEYRKNARACHGDIYKLSLHREEWVGTR